MDPIKSLDQIRDLLRDLPVANDGAMAAARMREATLVKPPGALGRLEELSEWLSGWQGHHPPKAERCQVAVFAGSHGVTAEGVSAFPAEVTEQMVEGFKKGAAAINQLCQIQGCELKIYEVAVEIPTRNFMEQSAMEDDECAEAMAFGMSAVEEGLDVLCLGEMGIGNTTAAAAVCHGLYGQDAEFWVGPGTGVVGDALKNKIRVVNEGVAKHKGAMTDGLEVLRHVGGRELAAMAGAIIAARMQRIPILLDGYVCTAAAAVLQAVNPTALDHCVVGHVSAEPGHIKLLTELNKEALLDLGMRLGEGSGAAIAVSILHAAVACHTGMGSFDQAGVAEKNPD
ncbi:MAG: nicotinate-nucleotide--dimethylbenzimidazole phosphoribosyltransferase [Alphaproteobacteria bacterium]|nr:nicotinate-nucleotide--dimethylbenzimidazole phosphoribosyltransferase [Alphaproteobacteria bacterium]